MKWIPLVILLFISLIGITGASTSTIEHFDAPPVDAPVLTQTGGIADSPYYSAALKEGKLTVTAGDVWISSDYNFNTVKFTTTSDPLTVSNTMKYTSSWGSIELKFTNTEIKENIILTKKIHLPVSHRLTLSPGSTIVSELDGSLSLNGPDGIRRMTLNKPFATDALGKYYSLSYKWDGSVLTLTGDLSKAAFPVVVDPSYLIESAGSSGYYTSLAIDSLNHPHIAYTHQTNYDLKYAAWNGTAWNIETVDSTGYTGYYPSIELDSNDYPRIAYYDASGYDLEYAAWNGTAWNKETVDSTGSVGAYTSIKLDSNDYPHISYYNNTGACLKYAAWNGTAWNIETVDNSSGVGVYTTSIELDSNDYPRIAYQDDTNDRLKYAAWNGTAWNIEIPVSSLSVGTYYVSLTLNSDEYPYISYNNNAVGLLKCTYWSGASWTTQTAGSNGQFSSIVMDSNDYPNIAYHITSTLDLGITTWNGTAWNKETLESEGNVGRYLSFKLDDGYRHISYQNTTSYDLRYYTDLPSPTAAFSANDTTITEGQSVLFTDASTPTSGLYWQWDVDGDGDIEYTTQNCTHTYSSAGTYTVNLTVTNIAGNDTESKVDYITVSVPDTSPPVAAFSANNTTPLILQDVLFTDESTGTPLTWNWTFDDGTGNITDQNPTHNWSIAGTYTVILSVTNATGSDSETKVDYITVSEPPVPTTSPTEHPTQMMPGNRTLFWENTTYISGDLYGFVPVPIWGLVVLAGLVFFVHSIVCLRYTEISSILAAVLMWVSAWLSNRIGFIDVEVSAINNTSLVIEPTISASHPGWLVWVMVMFALIASVNIFYQIWRIYLKPVSWDSVPQRR